MKTLAIHSDFDFKCLGFRVLGFRLLGFRLLVFVVLESNKTGKPCAGIFRMSKDMAVGFWPSKSSGCCHTGWGLTKNRPRVNLLLVELAIAWVTLSMFGCGMGQTIKNSKKRRTMDNHLI